MRNKMYFEIWKRFKYIEKYIMNYVNVSVCSVLVAKLLFTLCE